MGISSGKTRTKRLTVNIFSQEFVFEIGITNVLIKNTGLVSAKIWFDDANQSDAYTVNSGEKLPEILVSGGLTKLRFITTASETTLELLMWG